MTDGPLVVVSRNPIVRDRLSGLAERTGRPIVLLDAFTRMGDVLSPAAVIVDLDVDGAIEAAEIIRERWPATLKAAFISMPDRERWDAASAVYDLVANRGAITAQLASKLQTWTGPPTGIRIRLFEERDAAGRLGLVHRQETSAGPVAIYHIGSKFCAVGDVCPHAGARLSDGPLEGGVITCPQHGSQFEVCGGARVRGPADDPIPSFSVVVENGLVYLHIEEDA